MRTRQPRLGIDIGRVIINGPAHPHGGDTAFFTGDDATLLATPEVPGAVATIARLVTLFDGQVWLVSKCGPRVAQRTLRWLAGHGFHQRTGVPAEHVRFCRTRADKRLHCEQLALTHFIDDHPEVHAAIRGAVDHQYLFGARPGVIPDHVCAVPTWAHAEQMIIATLRGGDLAPPVRLDRTGATRPSGVAGGNRSVRRTPSQPDPERATIATCG